MINPNGYVAPLSAKLRAAVQVPVIVAGRINQPQEAEQIIAAGQADACVMTRALICDPDMPGLAQAGQTDDIRACIGCNQACIGHFHLGFPISCIQHPETGRERLYGIRLLAAAGHEVTLAVCGYAAGESLQQYVRDRLLAAVARQRITVLPLVRPYGVDQDTVYLQHVLTEEPVLVEGVAGLVLACGAAPAGELLETLESAGQPAVGIGDCLAPRTVEEAVLDGLVAASAI
jgi:hypothetical protein